MEFIYAVRKSDGKFFRCLEVVGLLFLYYVVSENDVITFHDEEDFLELFEIRKEYK